MPNSGGLEGPTIAGFQYVRALGQGGFSDVYLYKQKLPRRHVAIKVLHVNALDRQARKQFVAEANLMAQLSSHPAIATIYSAGISDDGQPYFVMEYCSGGSLSPSYRTSPLSVADVLRTGVRVASALESAHAVGIFHRDVKPANILITDYGLPVLTDFGISIGDDGVAESTLFQGEQLTATTATGSGSQGISIPWAPPEAFDDVPVGTASSDIYSLGATLFSLLEGRSPYEVSGASNGPAQLVRRIERGELSPMIRPGLPDQLLSVIAQSMARDRSQRPPSALAVAHALQSIEIDLRLPATPIEIRQAAPSSDFDSIAGVASVDSNPRHAAVVALHPPLSPQDTVFRQRPGRVQRRTGKDVVAHQPIAAVPPRRRRRRVVVMVIIGAVLAVCAGIAVVAILNNQGPPAVATPSNSAAVAAPLGPDESLRLARTTLEKFAESHGGNFRATLPELKALGYTPGPDVQETVVQLGQFGAIASPYCISVKVSGDEAGLYSILRSGPSVKGMCPQRTDRGEPSPSP